MRVDEYMQACLQDPAHGYWQRGDTIGGAGDFITAPEISQTFGELIGLWCAAVWQSIGQPAPLRLVELGPGRGTLMRDALRAIKVSPQFASALSVHLVELSPSLRSEQERAIATSGHAPRWHENVRDVPLGPAILIANEFLDALPIRQLTFDEEWRERVVALGPDGNLTFAIGAPVIYANAAARPGAIAEVRPGEEALLADLASRADPLAALFIDYGPAEFAFGDTLQAVQRHSYADPLASPGSADLTAHVQFAALGDKARGAGLAADGPLTQAEFLGRLGLAERTAALMAANSARAGEIETAAHRLVSPTGMGTLFKVMAVRSAGLPPLVPFG
jgi:NADH dehydrogenase [ubiquinone] 1 alpha subcomplex assembly factor 7